MILNRQYPKIGGVDVETVDSDEESVESNDPPRPVSRYQTTMDALSVKHAEHEPSVGKKIREFSRQLDCTAISEDEFVREVLHLITATRTDCSCKVAMGLTYLFCSEKKKLISAESVRTIRRATRQRCLHLNLVGCVPNLLSKFNSSQVNT